MKEDSELFVGVELEFPIVEINGNKTNIEVTKNLFRTLANLSDFEVEKIEPLCFSYGLQVFIIYNVILFSSFEIEIYNFFSVSIVLSSVSVCRLKVSVLMRQRAS